MLKNSEDNNESTECLGRRGALAVLMLSRLRPMAFLSAMGNGETAIPKSSTSEECSKIPLSLQVISCFQKAGHSFTAQVQVLLCCREETPCTAINTFLSAMKLALEAGDLFQWLQLQTYAMWPPWLLGMGGVLPVVIVCVRRHPPKPPYAI